MNYELERNHLRESQIPLPQSELEFKSLCETVSQQPPKVFLEIGTRDGGSLYMLSKCCEPGATIISIDLPMDRKSWGNVNSGANKKKVAEELRSLGFVVHLIEANSHLDETKEELKSILGRRKIDLMFIDADHTFKGVLRDWELYYPLVKKEGMVAFHDINDSKDTPGVRVHFLWRVLKTLYRFEEWQDNPSKGFGIGLLWLK